MSRLGILFIMLHAQTYTQYPKRMWYTYTMQCVRVITVHTTCVSILCQHAGSSSVTVKSADIIKGMVKRCVFNLATQSEQFVVHVKVQRKDTWSYFKNRLLRRRFLNI